MKLLLSAIFCGVLGCAASASELVYTPLIPTFGGNPLNATQLENEASAQKPSQPTSSTATAQQSSTQEFVQMLQSQLYASVASQISTAVTGTGSNASGKIVVGSTTVQWWPSSDGSSKNISITDGTTGQTTLISVPNVSQ